MLSRNLLIFCSLVVLLVEADLDTNDGSIQAMSTDKDSTSDDAPTESMNVISPDRTNDEPYYYNGGAADASSTSAEVAPAPETSKTNVVNGPGGAANSVEEQDEDESPDSDEGVRKRTVSRSSKSQKTAGNRSSKPQSTKRRSRPSGRQM